MATHSSVLAWRIPGTEEPSGLPSVGLHRVGHDWSNLAAAAFPKYGMYVSVHIPKACWMSCKEYVQYVIDYLKLQNIHQNCSVVVLRGRCRVQLGKTYGRFQLYIYMCVYKCIHIYVYVYVYMYVYVCVCVYIYIKYVSLGWMKQKLELRLQGEISITSDTQMTPSLR